MCCECSWAKFKPIEICDSIHPAEVKLQPPVLRKVNAKPDRPLPVVISIPFGCATPIIDGREAGRIPARERRAKSTGPFCRIACAPSRMDLKDPYSEKRRYVGERRASLRGDIDHATHRIRSPQHALAPRRISIRSILSVVKFAKSKLPSVSHCS